MVRGGWFAASAGVAAAVLGGCSLAFDIRDNVGPLVDGAEPPIDASVDAGGDTPGEAQAGDGPGEALPDVSDASAEPAPTGWCALEAGTGHALCLDFDESDAGVGFPCAACKLSTTAVSLPFSMTTPSVNGGTAFILPPLAHVTTGRDIHVDLQLRFDSYPVTAAQPHVLNVVFHTAQGEYEVFIDPFTDGKPYLDEWAQWDPGNGAKSVTTNKVLVFDHFYHVHVEVNLDQKYAILTMDGDTAPNLSPLHTVGTVSSVDLSLGIDYVTYFNGKPTITTYYDNVFADSN